MYKDNNPFFKFSFEILNYENNFQSIITSLVITILIAHSINYKVCIDIDGHIKFNNLQNNIY